MDARGHIYSGPEDTIPPEDKARLDGFLRGREEADLLKDIKAAALEAKVGEMATAEAVRRSASGA